MFVETLDKEKYTTIPPQLRFLESRVLRRRYHPVEKKIETSYSLKFPGLRFFFVSPFAVADVEIPVKIVTNDGSWEVNKESRTSRAIISRFTRGNR